MAMNIYDTSSVLLTEYNIIKIKSLHIFVQTNFFARAKTELKLQSQLLKQKHPLPWPECLIL